MRHECLTVGGFERWSWKLELETGVVAQGLMLGTDFEVLSESVRNVESLCRPKPAPNEFFRYPADFYNTKRYVLNLQALQCGRSQSRAFLSPPTFDSPQIDHGEPNTRIFRQMLLYLDQPNALYRYQAYSFQHANPNPIQSSIFRPFTRDQ